MIFPFDVDNFLLYKERKSGHYSELFLNWHRTSDFGRTFISPQLYRKYAHLDHMILYQNPLYCIVDITDGKVKIMGAKSDYRHITPEEAGIPDRKWDGVSVQPEALDLSFSLSGACP